MVPDWVAAYIGLPYEDKGRSWLGVDCYGLARMVYRYELGIELPNLVDDYESADDAHVRVEAEMLKWKQELTPEPYYLVVMKMMGQPRHVGIMINDRQMLHSMKPHDSVIETISTTKWKSRIVGYFSYAA